jgi:lysozyme
MPAPNARQVGITIAAVISIAAAVASTFEGHRAKPYRDVTGIPTVCYGHTGKDIQHRAYTQKECDALLQADMLTAAQGVQSCVHAPMAPNQWAAFTDAAYNIGIPRFCRSSMASLANAGDRLGSCKALLLYVYAGGKKLAGLVKRREADYQLCIKP